MIFMFMCVMLLMRAASITWASGRGLGPENLEFFGPQMALTYRLDDISQGPKKSQFPRPNPLQLALVMDAARIKSIMHWAVYIIGAEIAKVYFKNAEGLSESCK
jgi:hypothetical protein